jgi:RNA polymerase sigma-70 factor (ECF subfamily)
MPKAVRPLSSLSDDQLVSMTQKGDHSAFSELMERHQSSCMKLALSILKDRSDAEDEVQNAFWKAFEHIGQFNRDAKFTTWLNRIVVNQCLMRLRQARRAKFLYLDDVVIGEDSTTLELPSETATPEMELGLEEVSQVLEQEIKRIPPLLRNVFVLRDVRELPMPEVAKKLGISVAAAKSRLLRARQELRTRMSRHEGRYGPATLLA